MLRGAGPVYPVRCSSIAPRYQAIKLQSPALSPAAFLTVYQSRFYASGPSWGDRNENNKVDVEEAAALQMAAVAEVLRVEEVVGGAEDAGVKATTRPHTKTNGAIARITVCPKNPFSPP